jgi:hypothetical protein
MASDEYFLDLLNYKKNHELNFEEFLKDCSPKNVSNKQIHPFHKFEGKDIYVGSDIETKEFLLVKRISPRNIEKLKRLRKLCENNVFIKPSFDFEKKIALYDYWGINLGSYYKKTNDKFIDKLIIFLQIVLAVKFMHDNKVAHRDLKMDNILRDEKKPIIRIIDLDDAIVCEDGFKINSLPYSSFYESPELIEICEQKDKKSKLMKIKEMNLYKNDIWCLGIIFYEIFISKKPYDKVIKIIDNKIIIDKNKKFLSIIEKAIVLDDTDLCNLSEYEKKTFEKIFYFLCSKPETRPNINEVFEIVKNEITSFKL